MSLRRIGPIPLTVKIPKLDWESVPTAQGFRSADISGVIGHTSAVQLSELVANRDRRQTYNGVTGVLDYLWADGDVVGPFRGWCLLLDFKVTEQVPWHRNALNPFSLSILSLGDNVEAVVEYSSATVPNDFGEAGEECIYPSFPNAALGSISYYDGSLVLFDAAEGPLREYDTTTPHTAGAKTEPLVA